MMAASRFSFVRCVGFVAVLALFLGILSPALADGAGPARKIVVFQDGFVNEAAQAGLVRALGGEPLRPLPMVNGMAVLLPPPAESWLAARAEVRRIDPDAVVQALVKPSHPGKPGSGEQPPQELPWGVNRIDAEWAWAASRGAGVGVAVVDTGIDSDHPDLDANIAGGVNYVSKAWWKAADPDKWDDDNGHGTHVAGIIAAEDNDIGVVGVAPEASLYAVKVLGKNGSGYVSDVISGVEWCIAQGLLGNVQVVNMSLGTDVDVPALHEACDLAAGAGLLLVAAAGNDGADVDYPGAYSSVIAVAATNAADARPSWSSPGSQVAIAAPGVSIKSTWKGGGYATASGTSMASPHVAGALALNLSADLCLSADDLPPAGADIYTGCGLVDAGEAATGTLNLGDDLP